MGRNMVAASQPLAVQAGVRALQSGGNAVDAALATAITLTVVEPTMNGIGSDAFCILWDGNRLHGLNASGRSPKAMTVNDFAGMDSMPERGWDTVTVPGAVSAWVALSDQFGKLPFERLFEDAIGYAENGFQVTPITARLWAEAEELFAGFPDFGVFLPDGRAPGSGELFRLPDQARTLEKIASSRGEAFYRGELAERIVAASKNGGGKMTMADLDAHQCDWVEPIGGRYRDHVLHEIPPNGQGLGALIMLGILEKTRFLEYEPDSADALHCQIESMKLAFADTFRYVSDPAWSDMDPGRLLDPEYLARRAELIDMNRAGSPGHGVPPKGGTVYLTAADESGMMVSYIQSNYAGFGSGIVIPGTGISLQNRGAGFTLEPGHPNQLAGGKRPFHTIIPAFLTKDGRPVMSFGVMGAHMQAQGHAQMLIRVLDQGLSPQAANDAPRWQVCQDNTVLLESGYGEDLRAALRERGHVVHDFEFEQIFEMGGAQLIVKTEVGYVGGSDPRKDGMAAGY
ncbi:MAG: gamma-glutamyltransferase family protein [Gammaproteobacteria bacterium]|nr:gamma-glutamyltransferase family protein [Gammaproteobacteria bacterium]MYD75554.1 gamma-glutamyltransferase family protein [Gammaproteobacteria bacterium]MYJ53039.1 gamma-glutamyltransferase family protein [Gammaproteobacteria bacterium]